MRSAALLLIALALGGCETTAEKSAQLEKAALLKAKTKAAGIAGLSVKSVSRKIKVLATAIIPGNEGGAAVVTVANTSASALSRIPISIDVKDSSGKSIYSNSAPGLSPSLVSIASLPAHGILTWVDDQIQASGRPASVSARVGEGSAVTGALPAIVVKETAQNEESGESGAEGTVSNPSTVSQQELAVYGVARSGARIVAAGRAVIPQVKPGASMHFQLFFVGSPKGAQLHFAAPSMPGG